MRLLRSDLELVVKSGFVYVPLLFDAEVDREIRRQLGPDRRLGGSVSGGSDCLLQVERKLFVKGVNIASLLDGYDRIDPDHYEALKKACLRSLSPLSQVATLSPQSKLLTIIFKIMPHFIRKGRGFERRHLGDEEILDLIRSKIELPARILEQADMYLDAGPMAQRLRELDRLQRPAEPLQEGPIAREILMQWFENALQTQIVNRERARVLDELYAREGFSEAKKLHIATLLYLAETGSFELDGFGFSRIGSRDDFLIYKRTGEYILKDYYARNYRFPDCRVAVPTAGALRPLVVETYKHPFLVGHASYQEICMSGHEWPDEFTAENIINLLEAGINALLYGYNARRRNGYHSLDPTMNYVKTIEFNEYKIDGSSDHSNPE